jgi:hypothetical protein
VTPVSDARDLPIIGMTAEEFAALIAAHPQGCAYCSTAASGCGLCVRESPERTAS